MLAAVTQMCDVEVERTAGALDEGDRDGAGGAAHVTRLVPLMRGQRAVNDR